MNKEETLKHVLTFHSAGNGISCVDVWNDTYEHLSHDRKQFAIYRSYNLKNVFQQFNYNCQVFIDNGKIRIYRGNTNDLYDNFQNNSFDILLIDADHSYQGVLRDYSLYKNKVKKDGFIVFHDYGDCMWNDIKKFCDFIVAQKELEIITIYERIAICKLLEVN